ncbi:hypothetical protein OIU34_19180 [Pararhizobium sp. BT-229]|uniref:hypothetical protein n=1 Tax=Pararhizobium sp. BT-229 TaxID=2986923 RepID=UPI0021F7ABFC|nr:hypothetical protein [Pararhizobium sp. BT-229]MCV9964006.1 hypothetical protein [Pararhizobium sp. BT-229]
MLTRRAIEVLNTMIAAEKAGDHDDAEIVCEGRSCWLGIERLTRKLVDSLVLHVAVSEVSEPGSLERYVINGTGRRIADNPEIADAILKALAGGQAFDEAGNPLG